MSRILTLAAVVAGLSGCASPARFVEQGPDHGVVAIPANTNPGETRRSKTRDILVRAVQKALNTVPTTRTPVSLNSRMTLVVSARRVWSLRASMTTLPARKATFCASA